MNLLEIIQEFTVRTGLTKPSFVAGNTDPQVVQLMGLFNEVCENIVDLRTWTQLDIETTFVTVNGADQGLVTAIAGAGFKHILNDTIYNRTLRLPVYGPIPASTWQGLKALPTSGPFYKYRIRGGKLLFDPPATAGDTCAFEFASSYCLYNTADVAYKALATKDADEFLLPYHLAIAGLRWCWKKEKGLDYAEDFRRYEEMVNNAGARDGTKPTLSMDAEGARVTPGIFVPSGNWNVP
jgi:hypothetical protein